uniref:SKP1 component dimerisation domain-containing protein n=1 Tax=Panagrolaimus sp. ES5 TaxID=591445 RepID=A0AC34FJU1_9BILA
MFEDSSNFIEATQNCVTITNFKPKIVEKMIEFCVTDNIDYDNDDDYDNGTNDEKEERKLSIEKFEEDMFKIAHFYQIDVLLVSFLEIDKLAVIIDLEIYGQKN